MIPARYASTRFPAKLMCDLGGKSVILRTYEATLATKLFNDVYVVTDSDVIFREIVSYGGKAIMSIHEHESGSDRIAEAVMNMDVDIIVNVQGDEPFTQKKPLEQVLSVFKNDISRQIDLASLMRKIENEDDIKNPNNVKVIVDHNNFALYFSRSVIPFIRDVSNNQNFNKINYFQHIGIYAFRKQAIIDFHNLPMRDLEASEKLEQLRYLEYGRKIKMVETDHVGVGIDTPEDLEKARTLLWSFK